MPWKLQLRWNCLTLDGERDRDDDVVQSVYRRLANRQSIQFLRGKRRDTLAVGRLILSIAI